MTARPSDIPKPRERPDEPAARPLRTRPRPFLLPAALAILLGLGAVATRTAYRALGPPALWRSVLERSRAGDDMGALASAQRLIARYPRAYEAHLAQFLEAVVRITVGDPRAQDAFRAARDSALEHLPDERRPDRRLALLRCALAASLLAGPDVAVAFPWTNPQSHDLRLIPCTFLEPCPVGWECDFHLTHQLARLCLDEPAAETLTGTARTAIRDLVLFAEAVVAEDVADAPDASRERPQCDTATELICGRVLFEGEPAAGAAVALWSDGLGADLARFVDATFLQVLEGDEADDLWTPLPGLEAITHTDENGRYEMRAPHAAAGALAPQIWTSHRRLDPDWPVYEFTLEPEGNAAPGEATTIHAARAPYLTSGASLDFEMIAGAPPVIDVHLRIPPGQESLRAGWRLRVQLARVQPLDAIPVGGSLVDTTIDWPPGADTLDITASVPALDAHLHSGDPFAIYVHATRGDESAARTPGLQTCDLVRWADPAAARPLHEELLALALALRVLEEPRGDPAELLAAALAPLPDTVLRAYYCWHLARTLAPRQPERVRRWIGQVQPSLDARSHWTEQLMRLRDELTAGSTQPAGN